MKKEIKVKLRQISGRQFRVQTITNAIHLRLDVGKIRIVVGVGEVIDNATALEICEDKRFEVIVEASPLEPRITFSGRS